MAEQVRLKILPDLLDRVKNAPQLHPWLEMYWAAYVELSTCRPPGMSGVPSIPWTAIADYARTWGFDFEQFGDLVYYVRRMDGTMSDWSEKHHG